LYINFTRY